MDENSKEEIRHKVTKLMLKLYEQGFLSCGFHRMIANVEFAVSELIIALLEKKEAE